MLFPNYRVGLQLQALFCIFFRFITGIYSVQYNSRLALTLETKMVNSNRDCIMDLNQNLIELRGLA